eukprot:snap_masked-scaffold_5-processed-gene-16.46-mRNA-1 protein AED:1.00 eAED:1.00 QI:0/-1/0/0/-1/1/1/0/90
MQSANKLANSAKALISSNMFHTPVRTKMKTNGSVKKRFRVTKSGNIKHKHTGSVHKMRKHSRTHNQKLAKNAFLEKGSANFKRIVKMSSS